MSNEELYTVIRNIFDGLEFTDPDMPNIIYVASVIKANTKGHKLTFQQFMDLIEMNYHTIIESNN